MASKKQLNDLTLRANNDVMGYEAGTLKIKNGKGEYQIRNVVIGGGQTEQIFSVDITTKVAELKFTVPCTEENEGIINGWKDNLNDNVFELSDSNSGYTKIVTQAAVMNDPEFDFSTEGSVEIEVKGNPAQ